MSKCVFRWFNAGFPRRTPKTCGVQTAFWSGFYADPVLTVSNFRNKPFGQEAKKSSLAAGLVYKIRYGSKQWKLGRIP